MNRESPSYWRVGKLVKKSLIGLRSGFVRQAQAWMIELFGRRLPAWSGQTCPRQTGPSTNSPERWNRYAYAINNPQNFTDPDGLDIYVEVHRVSGSRFFHSSIRIEPTALMLNTAILALGLSYDDGGLGSALILTLPVWGFMYWLPGELLYSLSNGHSIPGHWLISMVVGLVLCLVADLSVRRFRRRRRHSSKNEGASSS